MFLMLVGLLIVIGLSTNIFDSVYDKIKGTESPSTSLENPSGGYVHKDLKYTGVGGQFRTLPSPPATDPSPGATGAPGAPGATGAPGEEEGYEGYEEPEPEEPEGFQDIRYNKEDFSDLSGLNGVCNSIHINNYEEVSKYT